VIFSISPASNSCSWRDATVSFSKFSSLLCPPSIRIKDLTRAHVIQKWTGIFSSCVYAFSTFLHACSQTSSSKVPSLGSQGLYSQITSKQFFKCCLETWAPPHNKKWCMSERKHWTLHWFYPILSHLPPSVWVSTSLSKLSFRSLFRAPAIAVYWQDMGDWSQKWWGELSSCAQ
jgi:hypothetical protein